MKEYSSYTSLKVEEVERGILLVTFQRPAHLNAVTREVVVELTEVFFEAGNNEEIDSVILTGEGRAFSAGVEIDDLKKGLNEAVPIEIARRMLLTVIECPRITIAALNGDAAGRAEDCVERAAPAERQAVGDGQEDARPRQQDQRARGDDERQIEVPVHFPTPLRAKSAQVSSPSPSSFPFPPASPFSARGVTSASPANMRTSAPQTHSECCSPKMAMPQATPAMVTT